MCTRPLGRFLRVWHVAVRQHTSGPGGGSRAAGTRHASVLAPEWRCRERLDEYRLKATGREQVDLGADQWPGRSLDRPVLLPLADAMTISVPPGRTSLWMRRIASRRGWSGSDCTVRLSTTKSNACPAANTSPTLLVCRLASPRPLSASGVQARHPSRSVAPATLRDSLVVLDPATGKVEQALAVAPGPVAVTVGVSLERHALHAPPGGQLVARQSRRRRAGPPVAHAVDLDRVPQRWGIARIRCGELSPASRARRAPGRASRPRAPVRLDAATSPLSIAVGAQ